jgi:hypothetical protein
MTRPIVKGDAVARVLKTGQCSSFKMAERSPDPDGSGCIVREADVLGENLSFWNDSDFEP